MILYEEKESSMTVINQKHKTIQKMEQERKDLQTKHERYGNIKKENTTTKEEVGKLKLTLNDREKIISTLYEKCTVADAKESGNQDVIEALKRKLKGYADRVTTLETKLDQGLSDRITHGMGNLTYESRPLSPTEPKVILFHDSMCGKINDTLCSREKIKVEKVWAPQLINLQEEIDKLEENVDLIAIHTMTNDLKEKMYKR